MRFVNWTLRALDPRGRTLVADYWFALAWWMILSVCLSLVTSVAYFLDTSKAHVGPREDSLTLRLTEAGGASGFAAVAVCGIVVLSCLYVRRMRASGLPTWLVVLPNLPTAGIMATVAFPSAYELVPDGGDLPWGLTASLGCWVVANLLTLVPSRGDGVDGAVAAAT